MEVPSTLSMYRMNKVVSAGDRKTLSWGHSEVDDRANENIYPVLLQSEAGFVSKLVSMHKKSLIVIIIIIVAYCAIFGS